MPEFPRKEADVAALGRDILGALKDNFDGLHGAPVSAAELEALLSGFSTKSFAAMQARAAAKKLSGEKRADFKQLKKAIR